MSVKYDDSSIKVLSDIQHVRMRASMYISTDRPSYQMWSEIADNAVDEAMNGFATSIIMDIDYDNSKISITDNGRGLPQGINKTLNKPTIEIIYAKLNAGGKYDQEAYNTSGGLNGVGSTVVNALSSNFHVITWRDAQVSEIWFSKGEKVDYKTYVDKKYKGSGTTVDYTIDTEHQLFTDKLIDYKKDIEDKLTLTKTLFPSVNITYNGVDVKPTLFKEFLIVTKEPLLENPIYLEDKSRNLMVALNWSIDTNRSTQRSYCNSIFTVNGGDHEKAVYDAVSELLGSDALYGINIAISVNYPAVEFDSQAKTKAISKAMKSEIKEIIYTQLKSYLRKNQSIKEQITSLIKKKRQALDHRNNKSNVKRDKKSTFLNALGDTAFADCTTKDRSEAELFIVEGNSAAGSARQSRNVNTQAVAPLRGKFINSYNNSIESLFKNKEVQMLLSSIDCGCFNDVNVARSRYGKIVIMADADADGYNIVCLLLSFFMNVVPDLIKEGYIYVALPPLYGTYDKKSGSFIPITTESVRNEYLNKGYEITRMKGLGEMNPDELSMACMDPNTRSIVKVNYTNNSDKIVEKIMGGDSGARKELLIRTGVLSE